MGKISSLQMNAMYNGKGGKVDMSQWIDAIVADAGVVTDTMFEGKIVADRFIETKLG